MRREYGTLRRCVLPMECLVDQVLTISKEMNADPVAR